MAGAQLNLYNVQFEDSGTYGCDAMNARGKDYHTARVSVEGKRNFKCHVSKKTRAKSASLSTELLLQETCFVCPLS